MPPKKCTSICTKKKTIDECNADGRCKYANGKIRKYCHLSSKYTFDNLCNITYRDKNIKLPPTVKLPTPIVSPPTYEEPIKTMQQPQPIKKINSFDLIQSHHSSNSSKKVKRTIKKINPFNLIQGYSSNNSSKKVKKTIKKINPFDLIQGYSSNNSSKQVKRSIKKPPRYIIESSNTSPVQLPITTINSFDNPRVSPLNISVEKVYKSKNRKPFTIIDSDKSSVKESVFSKIVEVPSIHEEVPSVHEEVPSVHEEVPSVHEEVPSVHEEVPEELQVQYVFPKKKSKKTKSKKVKIVEPLSKQKTSSRTRKASQLISNLLFKKRDKIRSNFLNTICSDSGFCIALGKEEKIINAFFDYFITFKYAISPVVKIGEESSNGFIQEILYEREKYKSYAVLKSQKVNGFGASLIYEYFVGQYINTLTTKFPLFIKTYGLLKYKSLRDYNISEKDDNIDMLTFKNFLEPELGIDDNITDFSLLCNNESYLYCVLIEHLNNPTYIETIFKLGDKENLTQIENYELNYEIPNILYQIYFVLNSISNNFTHYDLHYNNVLLYKPKEFGYLTYHYHTTGKVPIIFDSQYIVKIIDYGSCFYKYDEHRNSNSLIEKICNARVCGTRCGKEYGFNYVGLSVPFLSEYFINKRKKNASHDLRLIHMIKSYTLRWLDKYKINDNTNKILNVLNKTDYKKFYGTPEDLKITTYTKRNRIRNIIQLKQALDILMQEISKIPSSNFLKTNAAYTKLGDLHIYDDGRPMIYEATSL